MRAIAWLGLVSSLAFAVGCGSGAKTYPVEGKIVFKGKGSLRSLIDGRVRFVSAADANLTGVGMIEPDGAFSIGALPAGEYLVRIEPPGAEEDNDDDVRRPRLVHPRFLSYETSRLRVTVPLSAELLLQIER